MSGFARKIEHEIWVGVRERKTVSSKNSVFKLKVTSKTCPDERTSPVIAPMFVAGVCCIKMGKWKHGDVEFSFLSGDFKYVYFHPENWEIFNFDSDFSKGVKPPSSHALTNLGKTVPIPIFLPTQNLQLWDSYGPNNPCSRFYF